MFTMEAETKPGAILSLFAGYVPNEYDVSVT
jgi:hypothetical protein